MMKDNDYYTQIKKLVEIAEDSSTSPERLMDLRAQMDRDVRCAVLGNPNTPLKAYSIGETDSVSVRCMIAKSLRTPISVLRELALDEQVSIKQTLASNLNVPLDVLLELGEDGNTRIWWDLACNPNVPVAVAAKFFLKFGALGPKLDDSWIVPVPATVLVELLKEKFPGVTVSMPKTWLVELAKESGLAGH